LLKTASFVIRSAPTITLSIFPWRMIMPAMLSQMRVTGMLSSDSSQAVSLLP
jgi:hypothetical protein